MIIREAEVVVNPVDNVTPFLNKIASFLGRLSGGLIDIKLDDKIFDSFDMLEENLDHLGENLDIKMAVQTDTSGAEDGLSGIEASAEKSTNAVDKISAAGQQMGNVLQDAGKKGKGAFAAIGDSLGELSNNIGNMTASLAGIAAGGAIAGLSWKAAVESGLSAEQLYEKFDRNKTFKVSGEKLETWSKGFEGAGWTDSSDMRNLADVVYTSGGKNVQGDKGLEMAEQIGKIQAGKVGGLGVAPETFVRLIESKEKLPKDSKQRQLMAEALGTSQDDKRLNSRKGREELLKTYSESAAIQKGIDSQPWIAASNAVDNLQKAIGKTLIPTMTVLVNWFTKIVNFLENVPGVPWLIGLGAIAVTVAGSIKLLTSVFGPLISIMGAVKSAVLGQAAAEVTMTAASRAASAASKAESVAKMEEAIATRMASQAGISDTAIASQNAIAKRARAAADLAASRAAALNAIETSANTGAQVANTGAANAGIGARVRLAAATMYHSVAARLSAAATMLGAAASWGAASANAAEGTSAIAASGGLAALTAAEAAATTGATALAGAEVVAAAPLWPFIAGAAVLAGALAVLAAKAGFLKPLLDGFGKMKWGKALDDFAKGDFGKAWQDLFKGFKLPSLGKMWSNLTKGMPDLVGKVTIGGPFALLTTTFTKLTSGVDLVGNVSQMIYEALKKIKDIWDGFVGWLKGSWKYITELPENIGNTLLTALSKIPGLKYLDPGTKEQKPGDTYEKAKEMLPNAIADKLSPDQLDWLAKYVAGMDLGGVTGNDLAITSDMLKQALKLKEKLGAAKEPLAGGQSGGISSIVEPIIKPLADAGRAINAPAWNATDIANKYKAESGITETQGADQVYYTQNGKLLEPEDYAKGLAEFKQRMAEAPATSSTPEASEPTRYKNVDPSIKSTVSKADWDNYGPADKARWIPAYAKGTASVPKTGPAIVHEGERIIPAMDNKALTSALGRIQPSREVSRSRTQIIQVAGSTYQIINPVVPDVGAAYQLTDILKRQLDPFIEESVKRKIGQYIT